MEKNILIAGKDIPFCSDFAQQLLLSGCNVVAAGKTDSPESSVPSEVKAVSWNKSSAISARSVIIQAETLHNFADDAILYFDAPQFVAQFGSLTSDSCAPAADAMILGYQYLTIELLNRIEQHKAKSRIIFLLKTCPTTAETSRSASLKKTVSSPANAIVAAAEASFATFAENIAATTEESQYASVLLVTGDSQNETMQNDRTLAKWLFGYIDALDAKKDAQKSSSWIKAGAKAPAGFALFRQ